MRSYRLFLAALLAVFFSFGSAAPASAALPPWSCRRTGAWEYCVSNDGTFQAASMQNVTDYQQSLTDIKLELVFYEFGQMPDFGRVLSRTDAFRTLAPRQTFRTPPFAYWYPGIFCARVYTRGNGMWQDVACADTNGRAQTAIGWGTGLINQ